MPNTVSVAVIRSGAGGTDDGAGGTDDEAGDGPLTL